MPGGAVTPWPWNNSTLHSSSSSAASFCPACSWGWSTRTRGISSGIPATRNPAASRSFPRTWAEPSIIPTGLGPSTKGTSWDSGLGAGWSSSPPAARIPPALPIYSGLSIISNSRSCACASSRIAYDSFQIQPTGESFLNIPEIVSFRRGNGNFLVKFNRKLNSISLIFVHRKKKGSCFPGAGGRTTNMTFRQVSL